MELDKKCHNSDIPDFFLRVINGFESCLNKTEKGKMSRYKKEIEANIEALYDKTLMDDIKDAIKEMKNNDTSTTIS